MMYGVSLRPRIIDAFVNECREAECVLIRNAVATRNTTSAIPGLTFHESFHA